jgi:hypothetical protein
MKQYAQLKLGLARFLLSSLEMDGLTKPEAGVKDAQTNS